jgi:hypothetical protein
VATDPLTAGLAAILASTEQIADEAARMQRADEAAAIVRQFESLFCHVRDSAIRTDREKRPNRSVTQLVGLTGISRATIMNARRITRPVRYQYPDEDVRRVIGIGLLASRGAADPRAETKD